MKKIALKLLDFYQRFLTLLSFGSCRYYPTCSQYSIQQFETNSLFKAFYFTIVRILKCNQLFIGGIDYPSVNVKLQNINTKYHRFYINHY